MIPDGLSFMDRFAARARETPNAAAFAFLAGDGTKTGYSVSELYRDMQWTGSYLRSHGVQSGDLIAISCGSARPTVVAFLGAMYIGAVPAILPYYHPRRTPESYLAQLRGMLEVSRATALLIEDGFLASLAPAFAEYSDILVPLPLPPPDGSPRPTNASDGGEAAHAQFSSGTTGTPRCIINSKAQILYYLRKTIHSLSITDDDCAVGWLPLYHDMGLVTQILQPLYSGYPSVLLEPADWLAAPSRFFQAIDAHRGTMTWMPNFAFNYSVKRVDTALLTDTSLGSLRIVGCGAEPVQISALEQFAQRFAPFGLPRTAITVGYGMAEHVAGMTLTPVDAFPMVDWVDEASLQKMRAVPSAPATSASRPVVSCGYPKPRVQLRIVDGRERELGERELGEVWVKSPGLFARYHGEPAATEAAFVDGWFKTGDLGYLAAGQLYLCGRKKDLIIAGGQNISPHVVEKCARDVLGQRCRYAVAFAIHEPELGTDVVALACEMRKPPLAAEAAAYEEALRATLQERLGIFAHHIALVERGWIVKTTSGKLNRAANRARFEAALADVAQAATERAHGRRSSPGDVAPGTDDRTATEARLRELWRRLLGRRDVGANDSFFDLGGDSLLAIRMLSLVEDRFDRKLSTSQLFRNPTISSLVQLLANPPNTPRWSSLVPLQARRPGGHRPNFFCVHGLGGGVLGYQPLAQALGSEQPFYTLQARGLESDRIDTRIEDMAAFYIDEMRAVQARGPYHLGGFCFGGVVAYEMAQQLRAAGESVALVAVIEGYILADKDGLRPWWHKWRSLVDFLRNAPYWIGDYQQLSGMELRARMRRDLRIARLRAQRLIGLREDLTADDLWAGSDRLPWRHRTVMDANIAAMRQYRPRPYSGRVHLLRTARILLGAPTSDMGWGSLAEVDVNVLSGSHGTILNSPHVEGLASVLGRLLTPSASAS